jgi:pyrroline-5-carboxylate reductase
MIKVVLFGSGNVAQHLIIAFQQSGKVDVIQVVVRDKKKAELSIASDRITDNWERLEHADIYILAVSDGALHEL